MIHFSIYFYLLFMIQYDNIRCNPGQNETQSYQNDTCPVNNTDTNDSNSNDTNYLSCASLSNTSNSSAQTYSNVSTERTGISEGSALEQLIEEVYQEEVARIQAAADNYRYIIWAVGLVCLITGLGWLLARRQRQNNQERVFDFYLQRCFHSWAQWHYLALTQISSRTTSTPLWALLQVYLTISSIVMTFFVRVIADTLFFLFYLMGQLWSTIQSSMVYYSFKAAVRFMCTLPLVALVHLCIAIYCRLTGKDYNQNIQRYFGDEQATQSQADEPESNAQGGEDSQVEADQDNSDNDDDNDENIPSSSNNLLLSQRRRLKKSISTQQGTDTVTEDKQSENKGEPSKDQQNKESVKPKGGNKRRSKKKHGSKQSAEASSNIPSQLQRQHAPSSSSIPIPTPTPQSNSQQRTDTTTEYNDGTWIQVKNKKKERKQSKQNINQVYNTQQIQEIQELPQNSQAVGQQQQHEYQQQPGAPNQQKMQQQQPQQQQNMVQQQVNEGAVPVPENFVQQQQVLQQPQQQQVQQQPQLQQQQAQLQPQQQQQMLQQAQQPQQQQQQQAVLQRQYIPSRPEIQNHQNTIEKLQENIDPDWPTLTQAQTAALLAQNIQVQQQQYQQVQQQVQQQQQQVQQQQQTISANQEIQEAPREENVVPQQSEIVQENQEQQYQPQQQQQQLQQQQLQFGNPLLIWQNKFPKQEYFQTYEQYKEAFEVYNQYQNQNKPVQYQLSQWQMDAFNQLHKEYMILWEDEAEQQGYPYNQYPKQPVTSYYILPEKEYEQQQHLQKKFVKCSKGTGVFNREKFQEDNNRNQVSPGTSPFFPKSCSSSERVFYGTKAMISHPAQQPPKAQFQWEQAFFQYWYRVNKEGGVEVVPHIHNSYYEFKQQYQQTQPLPPPPQILPPPPPTPQMPPPYLPPSNSLGYPPMYPYNSNPYITNPYNLNPYNTNPYNSNPYDSNPYNTNPYNTNLPNYLQYPHYFSSTTPQYGTSAPNQGYYYGTSAPNQGYYYGTNMQNYPQYPQYNISAPPMYGTSPQNQGYYYGTNVPNQAAYGYPNYGYYYPPQSQGYLPWYNWGGYQNQWSWMNTTNNLQMQPYLPPIYPGSQQQQQQQQQQQNQYLNTEQQPVQNQQNIGTANTPVVTQQQQAETNVVVNEQRADQEELPKVSTPNSSPMLASPLSPPAPTSTPPAPAPAQTPTPTPNPNPPVIIAPSPPPEKISPTEQAKIEGNGEKETSSQKNSSGKPNDRQFELEEGEQSKSSSPRGKNINVAFPPLEQTIRPDSPLVPTPTPAPNPAPNQVEGEQPPADNLQQNQRKEGDESIDDTCCVYKEEEEEEEEGEELTEQQVETEQTEYQEIYEQKESEC